MGHVEWSQVRHDLFIQPLSLCILCLIFVWVLAIPSSLERVRWRRPPCSPRSSWANLGRGMTSGRHQNMWEIFKYVLMTTIWPKNVCLRRYSYSSLSFSSGLWFVMKSVSSLTTQRSILVTQQPRMFAYDTQHKTTNTWKLKRKLVKRSGSELGELFWWTKCPSITTTPRRSRIRITRRRLSTPHAESQVRNRTLKPNTSRWVCRRTILSVW